MNAIRAFAACGKFGAAADHGVEIEISAIDLCTQHLMARAHCLELATHAANQCLHLR